MQLIKSAASITKNPIRIIGIYRVLSMTLLFIAVIIYVGGFFLSVQSENQWVRENLQNLVKKYSGRWVVVLNHEVVFADVSFDIVLQYGLDNLEGENYVLKWIDSGDLVIYAFTISNNT